MSENLLTERQLTIWQRIYFLYRKKEPFPDLFSHSVTSDTLRLHGLQHARPLCALLSWSLLRLMSIESTMPSNHLILCCPLLLLPSIFPSIRVFPSESTLHIRWPEYWSFSFSISQKKGKKQFN